MNKFKNINIRIRGIMAVAVLSLVFSSCEEYPKYTFQDENLPESSFTIETNGLEVTFINESFHAVEYLWDFGDGETSTEKNTVVHKFASKNEYTVTLTAIDGNGVTDEFSTKLAVGYPTAGFEYEVPRSTATFTNTSDNATSYTWDFGDGETSSEENPVHEYAAAGDYTVTLTVTDGTDEDVYEESIFVPGKLIPEFIAPSFEIDSYRSDWDWNGASSSGAPTPPDGSRGAKFGPDDWIGQTLQVDPNSNYTLKFWFVTKSESLPIGARVEITNAASDEVLLDSSTGPSASSNDYEETSFTFNTEGASSIVVKILYGDGETRVDLFSIE
ncbi:MAG TPA: PKD domain-containing protein [Bacteroidales bacterium]|nr:PKD domain-containing protein [Bacteroidales bacterium]